MVTPIILPCGQDAIVITPDAQQWSQVVFRSAGMDKELGAEMLEILVQRLMPLIAGRGIPTISDESGNGSPETSARDARAGDDAVGHGWIDGRRVTWIMTLNESHSAIYATRNSSQTAIYVQDRDGKMIATLTASPQDLNTWERALQEASE